MNDLLVVTALIAIPLFIFGELAGAVLPMIIAIALVPPSDRHGLAELLAATDGSRRLRFWRTLRLAVAVRRFTGISPCGCRAPGIGSTGTASTESPKP